MRFLRSEYESRSLETHWSEATGRSSVERTLARLRADFPLVEDFPGLEVSVITPPAFAASTNRRYRLLDCWASIGEEGGAAAWISIT